MKEKTKNLKQRWTRGALIEIDLQDGTYVYGQVLEDPLVAFFDILRNENEERPSIDNIKKSNLLFRVSVFDQAIENEWLIIGKSEYDKNWDIYPSRYVIDSHTGEITIWKSEGGQVKANLKDIEGMECFAVWDSFSVEQRLRDHFGRRPSWYVEHLKPGWKRISAKEFYAQYGYDFNWLDEDKKEKP